MSFETFIRGVGRKISTGLENIKNDREARLRDPAFQRELMESRKKFFENLTNTGINSVKACWQLLLWAHLKGMYHGAVQIIDSKAPAGQAVQRYLDEIMDGLESGKEAVLSGTFTIGRALQHMVRWLFAK